VPAQQAAGPAGSAAAESAAGEAAAGDAGLGLAADSWRRAPLALSRSGADRAAHHRVDEAWLAAAWADPATRVLVLAEGRALVVDIAPDRTDLVLLPPAEAPAGDRIYLGTDEDGVSYFAVTATELPAAAEGAGARAADLREVGASLGDREAGLLVHAVALENWHRSHRFCPRCGHHTRPASAGHVRQCTACGREHYPRTDPAVIMLVTDDQDRALLGRQAVWPQGRYSTLAGFVEPGESLEQAVAREVREESGVVVAQADYVASQPWPFPCSLMLGFTARADARDGGTEIHVDGEELSDARWFSREELRAGMENGTVLPPSGISIARRLIELWYGSPLPDSAHW